MQMMVQKLSLIAVAVNRVHSFLWIQPQKIRIIFCIRTEREILIGKINRTVDLAIAIRRYCRSAFQKTAIFSQLIDYLIKLVIKLGRQKPLTMTGPVMKELIAAVTHICTQMTDAAGLSHNLVRLRIAVHLLGLCGRSYFNIHRLSSSSM